MYPYLVSPVDHDGNVKTGVLKDLVEHLIRKGVHGLTPLGSTGEFAYLTWEQKKSVVQTVIESSDGRVPVVAGVCHTSSLEAMHQAREFEAMGVDGILAIMDTYFPLTQQEVYSYFRSIANSLGDDIKLFSSSASIPLFVMMIGGVGWMAGPACVVSEKSVALYELALERKWDEAIALQKKLWQINYVFQKYNLSFTQVKGLFPMRIINKAGKLP